MYKLAPAPIDQLAGPAGDSITFSEAPVTEPNFLWDPDPSAPEDWWSTFASGPSQSIVPATLESFCQPTDTTESSLEDGNARTRNTSAGLQGQKERSLLEHKLEVNRRAQKRFRERRKEREQALDSQLVDTRAELQKLKAYQQQLETRNALLEKVYCINNQPDQSSSSYEDAMFTLDRQSVCDETSLNDEGRGVNITLPRHQQHMTVQQISKLRLGQFAALWTDYIRELGMLLVHLGDRGDPGTQASVEHVTLESTQLLGCLKAFNPSVYKAVCHERLDGANTVPAQQPDVSWFTSLQELLLLSDAQMQDFAHLRRLYLTKRALLAFERKKLVNQMQDSETALPHPADGQIGVTELAAKLRQNAADDYEVYIKLGYAVRRGVLSTKQWAMFIVHAYPFFPGVEAGLEHTAAGRGEPSMHDVIAGAQGSPMAADWAALNHYLSSITGEHVHDYQPIKWPSQHSAHAAPSKHAFPATLYDMLL